MLLLKIPTQQHSEDAKQQRFLADIVYVYTLGQKQIKNRSNTAAMGKNLLLFYCSSDSVSMQYVLLVLFPNSSRS